MSIPKKTKPSGTEGQPPGQPDNENGGRPVEASRQKAEGRVDSQATTITLDPTKPRASLNVRQGSRVYRPKPYPSAPYWAISPGPDSPWNNPQDPAGKGLPERYRFGKEIGRGGQGRILTVFDTELGRPVALKTVLARYNTTCDAVRRIIHEVQTTGQLEHPNIIPVYDMGQLANGEIFYTMRLVKGRTLADVIRKLAENDPKVKQEFSRVRLITILQQICQGIAFAHDRSVVHRDLKPSNIMLGDYGEVTVMDWGCAKVRRASLSDTSPSDQRVVTDHTFDDDWTVIGTVQGTPAYMSPEQAGGKTGWIDERTDIYALGAILYEMLTLHPPVEGTDLQAKLEAVQNAQLIAPRQRAPDQDIPEELEAVCLKCLAKNPDERYQNAHDLHSALEAYLEGTLAQALQEKEAAQFVQQGEKLAGRFNRLTLRTERLRGRAFALQKELEPWEPIERKKPLWQVQKDLERTEAHRINTFGEAVNVFRQALSHDPDNSAARKGLADLYLSHYLEAENRRDNHDKFYYETMVREFGQNQSVEVLEGSGVLSLITTPPGAKVEICQYVEVNQRLRPAPGRSLGRTPLNNLTLPRGSYLLVLTHPDHLETFVPLLIGRHERISMTVRMLKPGELSAGFIHIPAGPFLAAGDPRAPGSGEQNRRPLEDYAISRYPVTYEEYAHYLEALKEIDPEARASRSPRRGLFRGYHWAMDRPGDREGRGGRELPAYDPRWPVFGISWEDACAYCEWRSMVEGVEIRLPTEDEWEKAGRGADGRYFPWGDVFDPTFCKMWESREQAAMPEPVGSFSTDESPYGIRDLAGTVSEWCLDWYNAKQGLKLIKGGGWNSTRDECRMARRHGEHLRTVSPWIGFRTVRPLKLRD